jgi:hypothetical protein
MNLEVMQYADALNKLIRRDLNNYADDLASNQCKTIEDYRFLCGRLQGLADAELHLKDLIKTSEDSDDA